MIQFLISTLIFTENHTTIPAPSMQSSTLSLSILLKVFLSSEPTKSCKLILYDRPLRHLSQLPLLKKDIKWFLIFRLLRSVFGLNLVYKTKIRLYYLINSTKVNENFHLFHTLAI